MNLSRLTAHAARLLAAFVEALKVLLGLFAPAPATSLAGASPTACAVALQSGPHGCCRHSPTAAKPARLRLVEPLPAVSRIAAGADHADKVRTQLDDLFDRRKPAGSFRAAYVEITGDIHLTGLLSRCDWHRLRAARGAAEGVGAHTFGELLGEALNRALVREYRELAHAEDWQWLCSDAAVGTIRSDAGARTGGYGGPVSGASRARVLATRGGSEAVSLEAIAHDQAGVLRRIPWTLAVSARRTLQAFMLDFLTTNPAMRDGLPLFHASRSNVGASALNTASFIAARRALGSVRHLVVPVDLEETAHGLFIARGNDAGLSACRRPSVHVIDQWMHPGNWFATRGGQSPLIELGFHDGAEPAAVREAHTGESLFNVGLIRYCLQHRYSAAVRDASSAFGSFLRGGTEARK